MEVGLRLNTQEEGSWPWGDGGGSSPLLQGGAEAIDGSSPNSVQGRRLYGCVRHDESTTYCMPAHCRVWKEGGVVWYDGILAEGGVCRTLWEIKLRLTNLQEKVDNSV